MRIDCSAYSARRYNNCTPNQKKKKKNEREKLVVYYRARNFNAEQRMATNGKGRNESSTEQSKLTSFGE